MIKKLVRRTCDSCRKSYREMIEVHSVQLGEPAFFCPRCSGTLRAGIPWNRNDKRGWDNKPELIGDSTIKY